ncbi:MAG: hypothetical protein ACD_72C00190G0004 [uncultured bacterium]|nr:MAG: hypothetical protein ACD_72C00190G0004 [uncultured bacterium]
MKISKIVAIAAVIALVIPGIVFGAMSSTNYFIYADTVDFGGGVGTSTNYNLQESLGGYAGGISTSTNYQISAGFQIVEVGILSLNLDSNSMNFGTLSTAGAVATGNINATVDTNSATGYVLSISSVNGSSLTAVSDGAVDGAGNTEEYGLAVNGANEAYINDAAIVSSLTLASSPVAVSSDVTTLTFKAVRSSGSSSGTYSQNIVINAVANI